MKKIVCLGSKVRSTSIPLSNSIRASDLRILMFDDQSDLLSELSNATGRSQTIFAAVSLAILLLAWLITSSSFNRILNAISVLERMGDGDLSEVKLSAGFWSSQKDEVGRLQKAISEYRLHLVDAEVQRKDRSKRRDERDMDQLLAAIL